MGWHANRAGGVDMTLWDEAADGKIDRLERKIDHLKWLKSQASLGIIHAEHLALAREHLGFTQDTLSYHASVSRSAVGAAEKGPKPGAQMMRRLADFLEQEHRSR
jgi:DNA-binding XRE family transcriptional regulator